MALYSNAPFLRGKNHAKNVASTPSSYVNSWLDTHLADELVRFSEDKKGWGGEQQRSVFSIHARY